MKQYGALLSILALVGCDGGMAGGDAGVDGGPPFEQPALVGVEGVLVDLDPAPGVVEVELRAEYVEVDIGDGVVREMMGYNGMIPGPVLQANVGDEVVVHFTNQIWEDTTVHWHGLRISDEMDGSPRIQEPVAAEGGTFTYRFVMPEAGTFWYHPHVRTNRQLEMGLSGAIVVHDPADPVFDAERVVVLDDILIDPTGEIAPFLASHPEVMHGRNGNILLTNGRVSPGAPQVAQPGQVDRWRIVNVANARTMQLTLEGATLRVVGTDGGRLAEPYETERLEVPVGQRFDVEVHYGAGPVSLVSHVLALDDTGAVVEVPVPVYDVMVEGEALPARDITWPTLPAPAARTVDGESVLEFDAIEDPVEGLQWRINGEANRAEPLFTYTQGQTVQMSLRNLAGPEHPFHLHGQFFEIVGRPGLYDTVLVPGFESVEIIAHLDNPGRWMAHCHILEHAELGMMSEIVVEPTAP